MAASYINILIERNRAGVTLQTVKGSLPTLCYQFREAPLPVFVPKPILSPEELNSWDAISINCSPIELARQLTLWEHGM
jgi:hypothetical protein